MRKDKLPNIVLHTHLYRLEYCNAGAINTRLAKLTLRGGQNDYE